MQNVACVLIMLASVEPMTDWEHKVNINVYAVITKKLNLQISVICCEYLCVHIHVPNRDVSYLFVLCLRLRGHVVIMLIQVADAVINLFFDVTFCEFFLDLCACP